MLKDHLPKHKMLVTMEENIASGGFGEHVESYVAEEHRGYHVLKIAIANEFVEHGGVDKLKKDLGIDADSAAERIVNELGK